MLSSSSMDSMNFSMKMRIGFFEGIFKRDAIYAATFRFVSLSQSTRTKHMSLQCLIQWLSFAIVSLYGSVVCIPPY